MEYPCRYDQHSSCQGNNERGLFWTALPPPGSSGYSDLPATGARTFFLGGGGGGVKILNFTIFLGGVEVWSTIFMGVSI